MTVSLDEFIGSLPQAEQTAIARRADELRAEVATRALIQYANAADFDAFDRIMSRETGVPDLEADRLDWS